MKFVWLGLIALIAVGCTSTSCTEHSDLVDSRTLESDEQGVTRLPPGFVGYGNKDTLTVSRARSPNPSYNLIVLGSDQDIILHTERTVVVDARLFGTAVIVTDKGVEVVGQAVNITMDPAGRICIDPAP